MERRSVEGKIQKHNWGIRLVMQAVAVGGQQKSKSNLAILQADAYFPMLLFSILACPNRWCTVFPVSRACRQCWIISLPPVICLPHFHMRAGVGRCRWREVICSTLQSLWEDLRWCCSVGCAVGEDVGAYFFQIQSFQTNRGRNLKVMPQAPRRSFSHNMITSSFYIFG